MNAPQSPVGDAIEKLVWGRLSSFWTRDYSPTDREKLNAIYEGAFTVLDAEYTRLFEINNCKSIGTIPTFTQRRWLRIDLNRDAEVAAFLKFLSTSANSTATSNASGTVLACDTDPHNHARHWHISFPFTVAAGDAVSRSIIELSYPMDIRLIQIYKMVFNPLTGLFRGVKLMPTVDYQVSASGTGIKLTTTIPGEQYDITVGLDFSSTLYDGLNPVTDYAAGYDITAPNTVRVDSGLGLANLPIHIMLVKTVRDSGAGELLETNTPTFSSKYIFIPYTGDSRGAQHGAVAGTVVLPNTVNVEPTDAVFVFGLVRGEFVENHNHVVAETLFNSGAAPIPSSAAKAAGSTSVVEFDTPIRPGIYGSLGYLGQIFQVLVDGELLPRTDYSFAADGKLNLKQPITWGLDEYRSVTVRTTDEYDTLHSGGIGQHLHLECLLLSATPPQQSQTFDDGGSFDDGGFFDDSVTLNIATIDDADANLDTLEVWSNGDRLVENEDYTATVDATTGHIQISYTFNIAGKSLYASYRRATRTYVYGRYETGFTASTLSGLLTDLNALRAAFSGSTGFQIKNIGRLIEAAQAAAAGGEPVLTLFYDEFPEYAAINTDSDNVAISIEDARLLESQGTKLIGIPFLVDRVLRPGVRLEAGVDYDVVDGEIQSSFDLTTARYENDAQPGVWWCPIVLLDEQMLLKNFGSLLGDVRNDSSDGYKTALQANLTLRFSGPIVAAIERTAAVFYGSPVFTQDGRVSSIVKITTGNTVAISDSVATQTVEIALPSMPPSVGDKILRSQSLGTPALFNGVLAGLISQDSYAIVAELPYLGAQAGDVVYLTTFDPVYPTTPIPFTARILTYVYDPNYPTARTAITLDKAPRFAVTSNSEMRILRDAGPPYAANDGLVVSVTPIQETVITVVSSDGTGSKTYTLDPSQSAEQRVGQDVERGQPLFQSYATLYDDARRPNWHWLTPADYAPVWQAILLGQDPNTAVTVPVDNRIVSIEMPTETGDYSAATLTPATPVPARGQRIVVLDDRTQETYTFTIVGSGGGDGTTVFVTPAVSTTISGMATVLPVPAGKTYFRAASPPENAPIQSQLAFAQPILAKSLQLQSTAGFPAAGDCSIRLPNGGSVQIGYNRVIDGFILDLEWPSSFPSLTDDSGVLTTTLPATSIVRMVSERQSRVLNPAFVALCDARVTKDVATSNPTIEVTEDNADALYSFLKNTSAVLETSAIAQPSVFGDLLADVLPPGASLVTINRHRIVDVYQPSIADAAQINRVLNVTTSPAPDTDGNITGTVGTFALASVVNDPNSDTPYTYQWEQSPTVDGGVSFATPTASSTTIGPLVSGHTYYVKLTVATAHLHSKSISFQIVVP